MPNWCSNRVRIYGQQERVDAFIEAVRGDEPGMQNAGYLNNE